MELSFFNIEMSKVVVEDEEEDLYEDTFEPANRLIYDITDEKEEEPVPSSSHDTHVHLKAHTERRTSSVVGNTKGLDVDAEENTKRFRVQIAKTGKKPWRKPGADISDYFNYGFDEESWYTYRKNQMKLRAANRQLQAEIMVQMGHTKHEEKESFASSFCSDNPSVPASRQISASTDVTEGQPGPSSRVEGQQCVTDEGNNTQVVTETSSKEVRIAPYHLHPPVKDNSLFVYVPPPSFLFQKGLPLSLLANTYSGLSAGLDDPSSSLHPCLSGVSSLIRRSMASSVGRVDTARECYMQHGEYDKDRDRSREHGHYRDSKRGRNRERESCSSHSGQEQMRNRGSTEQGHKCHNCETFSDEKEERHRKKRQRDKGQGRPETSCSSSRKSRTGGVEDRQSHSRHKHKKAKRIRKDKETNKMFSADQERKLKSD